MDETLDLLTIALLPDVGPRVLRALREGGPLSEVLARPARHAGLLPARAMTLLASGAARRRAEAEARHAHEIGARIVGWSEADYPSFLRQIRDPPPVLYVRGRLVADEGAVSVTIVGARQASPQGLALARAMARDLAGAGLTIVSGLARGIDAAAHRGAIEGGRTVAILGSGLDRVYPVENASLAAEIVNRGGAVVSEFPLATRPYPGNFPRRNRVVAGWGRAVVVVEAGEKSGALVTARWALDEGRDVFAVPGHPGAPGAAGTNALIRDGALLVRGAADVAEALGIVIPITEPEGGGADDLLAALRRDAPLSLEELGARCGRPAAELLARLTELETARRVRRLPGALYVRS